MKFFAKIRISQYYKNFILFFVQPAKNAAYMGDYMTEPRRYLI